MVPAPKKQKALAQKLPRNRTWDCEYDIYSHLQEKNRVLKCETEKLNYFNTLLQHFAVDDQKGDPELVQFMDGLYGIVKSQMLHLEYTNVENKAEEKGMDDDDNDEGVIVDPQHKYFMDHVRPIGKSYVLDIPEDGVYVEYELESSSPESAATYTTSYANHVYEEVDVCLDTDMHVNSLANCKSPNVINNLVKRRGRKPKGAKLSAAVNSNVKSSNVTSKAQKRVHNLMGEHRSKKLKTPPSTAVLVVIKDSDDAEEDTRRSAQGQIVEHCWHKYHEGNATTPFKEKLMEELRAPFCEEEYKRLLHDITVRKPVQHHRDLRGRIKIYDKHYLGKSYLDFNFDLAEKIKTARDDHPRVLNLLRGFFYWLKNLSHDGAFLPWRDPSCLDVLPQQSEG
ncbi:unnamed protein product [Sphenostylis stenocarpa]|uniref:Uncharacterized protein n=1 Tax=Sphenostylis stenocarpa TaxID=92480 RepID=A0AA86VN85_9FABA|nr:unnamed protein product [Sphenostylis stenocarpa]